jgi:hypothetical protein
VVGGSGDDAVEGGEELAGLLDEGADGVAEADALDGGGHDVAGLEGALDPQAGLFLGDVPGDVGALGAGDPDRGGVGELGHDGKVDHPPQLIGIRIRPRNKILVGAEEPVVPELPGRGAFPAAAPRLPGEHRRVARPVV